MSARRHGPRGGPPSDLPAALEVAFRFLAPRPRSRAEVARRLRRAGVREELVDECLQRLEELGYVDDREFARYWTEQRDSHAPRGRALLDAELRRLGLDADALRAARRGDESDSGAAERDRAITALRLRLRGRTLDASDPLALRRAADFLARRGFAYDVARAAVGAVAGGELSPDASARPED